MRWVVLAFAWIGGVSLALAVPPALVEKVFDEVDPAAPLPERLVRLTEPFLGLPYMLSPLGEGEGVDADPRLRFDAFDCLTFVETAMALASAPTFSALESKLDDVRYSAAPSFVNRNHFVEAQWLPANVLKGYVREVSSLVAPKDVVIVSKEFSIERWDARQKLGEMPLASDAVPRGLFSLPMVPLEVARARMSKIPAGTLLFVVRKELYTQPTRVTHVGLVIDKAGRKYLRHASGKPYQRVVDEPLGNFLARNANYKRWPVEGVALYRIETPGRDSVDVVAGSSP